MNETALTIKKNQDFYFKFRFLLSLDNISKQKWFKKLF